MTYNIGSDGNYVPVFVNVSGGVVDATIRCASLEVFEQIALLVGLKYEVTEDVIDPKTGEATKRGTGVYLNAKGVEIDHIGPVKLSDEVLDENGDVVTPAKWDTRHHVNFKLCPPASERLDAQGQPMWWQWALAWTINGQNENPNAAETAKVLYGVTLIDPETIRSPSRVWL